MLPIRQATADDIDQLVQLRLLLFEEVGEISQKILVDLVRQATQTYLAQSSMPHSREGRSTKKQDFGLNLPRWN